jgi:hypothetical protein
MPFCIVVGGGVDRYTSVFVMFWFSVVCFCLMSVLHSVAWRSGAMRYVLIDHVVRIFCDG